jgi:hypothetical protein
MARRAGDAISYQVSVRGKGLSAMSNAAMRTLLEKHVESQELPEGIDVSIQCWRAGKQLDMRSDNPRAQVLRDTFRRFLQAGRIELAFGDDPEDRRSL